MKFLQHEIESEENVRLVKNGFNLENVDKNIYTVSSR